MRAYLPRLRTRLSSEPDYFRSVYVFTFDFARTEGQRSLAVDSAIAFWQLLLPIGLSGRALAHIDSGDGNSGWESKYNDWWFEYLNEKGGKGISKDTWHMVRISVVDDGSELAHKHFAISQFVDFVRQIDSKFEKHDLEGLSLFFSR